MDNVILFGSIQVDETMWTQESRLLQGCRGPKHLWKLSLGLRLNKGARRRGSRIPLSRNKGYREQD